MPNGYRKYAFTTNNPRLEDFPLLVHEIRFLYFQCEIGENTGTIHFQGYVEFAKQITISAIKTTETNGTLKYPFFKRSRFENARGTAEQNIQYCCKDETKVPGTLSYKFGIPSRSGVKRSMDALIETIRTGTTIENIQENYLDIYIRHKTNIDSILLQRHKVSRNELQIDNHPLKNWQEDVERVIGLEPDTRKIQWWYEATGNTGKICMRKWLVKFKDAFFLDTTSKKDVIRAIQQHPRTKIYVFDIERKAGFEGRINYDVFEMLKNGCAFNTKYEPDMVLFLIPHVIVFSNFEPNYQMLNGSLGCKLNNRIKHNVYTRSPIGSLQVLANARKKS
jgi:hypothetical protein